MGVFQVRLYASQWPFFRSVHGDTVLFATRKLRSIYLINGVVTRAHSAHTAHTSSKFSRFSLVLGKIKSQLLDNKIVC